MKLHRYWIIFDKSRHDRIPVEMGYGCGITAFSLEDVFQILEKFGYSKEDLPIKDMLVDFNINELDENHVRKNMGSVAMRGIWFPIGYQFRD